MDFEIGMSFVEFEDCTGSSVVGDTWNIIEPQ
jgi:hypothetical protein